MACLKKIFNGETTFSSKRKLKDGRVISERLDTNYSQIRERKNIWACFYQKTKVKHPFKWHKTMCTKYCVAILQIETN